MKKMIFTLMCFCFAAMCAQAQTPEVQESSREEGFIIDYEAIKAIVTREGVYDTLAARFAENDSTLTMREIALLYYGFAFQPAYKGSSDQLLSPGKNLNKNEEYQKAWDEGLKYLENNPVSLTTLYELTYSGLALDWPMERVNPYLTRLFSLQNIIARSGNGKSCETAFKVISVADEYIFMRVYLEASGFTGQALVGMCDVITITNAEDFDGTEIYFDVSLPFKHMAKEMYGKEI